MSPDQDDLIPAARTEGDRKRRRIDAILDEHHLEGIEDADTDTLRQMRDDCRDEERVISYARRVVQGKLDVLHAEVRRRRDDGVATDAFDDLPEVLADERAPAAGHDLRPRAVAADVSVPDELRRAGERAANIEPLGDLGELDDRTLAKRFGKLAVEEERLSEVRSRLLDRIDRLNDEIARRYREGDADVADVLRAERTRSQLRS